MIVIFILHMLAAPFALTMMIVNLNTKGSADIEAFVVIGVLTTTIAACIGVICALSVFSYYYKKTDVDFRLGLPMTTSQRFVSDYLSGLFLYIAPFVVTSIISMLIILVGHITCDGKTFYYHHDYSQGTLCTAFETMAPYAAYIIFGGILIMIMLYTVTVMVSVCCGSLFECAGYTILANILIPGTACAAVVSAMYGLWGIDYSGYLASSTFYYSPIGAAVGLVFAIETKLSPGDVDIDVPFGKWFVITAIFTAIYFVLAFFLNKKRKAEDTGKPFAFKAFYYIMIVAANVCVVFLFAMAITDDSDMIIPMVIVTAIMNMLLAVIKNRGFKRFFREMAVYAATLLCCCGIYSVIRATDGLGVVYRVPDAENVSSVTIDYCGYENGFDYGSLSYIIDSSFTLESEEAIEKIISVHESAVHDEDCYYSGGSLEISYKLKTGGTVKRSYYKLGTDTMYLLTEIDLMEEMRQERAEYVGQRVDTAWKWETWWSGSVYSVSNVWVKPAAAYGDSSSDYYDVKVRAGNLPDDFVEQLKLALRNDIMNMTEEEYFTPTGTNYCIEIEKTDDEGSGDSSVYDVWIINDSYRETTEYLKSCGIKFESVQISASDVARIMSTSGWNTIMSDAVTEEVFGISVPSATIDIRVMGNGIYEYKGTVLCNYSRIIDYDNRLLQIDLATLLNVAQFSCITDESCYAMQVNGDTLIIPPEYSDVAERVYIQSVADVFYNEMTYADGDYYSDYYAYADNEGYYRNYIRTFLDIYDEKTITDSIARYIRGGYYYYDPDEFAAEIYSLMSDYAEGNLSFANDDYEELYD
ncbi:MAG: hypothetical protein LIO69_02340 [Oscillospiraceae bacterium]|nr:hypothetical protein [Oscillospiraceae bacterium]